MKRVPSLYEIYYMLGISYDGLWQSEQGTYLKKICSTFNGGTEEFGWYLYWLLHILNDAAHIHTRIKVINNRWLRSRWQRPSEPEALRRLSLQLDLARRQPRLVRDPVLHYLVLEERRDDRRKEFLVPGLLGQLRASTVGTPYLTRLMSLTMYTELYSGQLCPPINETSELQSTGQRV